MQASPTCHFDFNKWRKVVPVPEKLQSDELELAVCGPRSLVQLETSRRRLHLDQEPTRKPVDVFVLAKGEPEQRSVTKVGGLPFRSASKPWPRSTNGSPLDFLCQFSFAESQDILPPLPADVLLVFCTGENIQRGANCLHFEWQLAAEVSDLVQPKDVPAPSWQFVTCHGLRHRTYDLKRSALLRDKVYNSLDSSAEISFGNSDELLIMADLLLTIHGMKIGGEPIVAYHSYSPADSWNFLCSICTIWPHDGMANPWENWPDPLSINERFTRSNYLDLYDGFALNFHLEPQGVISWTLEKL